MDRILSDAITLGQSGPGIDGNEMILHILQISKARASLSDCLMSYQVTCWGWFYSSVEMQLVFSTAPADWADNRLWLLSIPHLFKHMTKFTHFVADLFCTAVWSMMGRVGMAVEHDRKSGLECGAIWKECSNLYCIHFLRGYIALICDLLICSLFCYD